MSRFCEKKYKQSNCDWCGEFVDSSDIDSVKDEGPIELGHCGKYRLEYDGGSVWIIDEETDWETFWSLEKHENFNLNPLFSSERRAMLEAFRLAVRRGLMICPVSHLWLMDEDNDKEETRLFLGYSYVCGIRGRCTWPIDSGCYPELVAESRRRAEMVGINVKDGIVEIPELEKKLMFSSVEPKLKSTVTIYNPAIDLLRELYNFGHWTVNDRLYGEQVEIWERVRKLLMVSGGTKETTRR